MSGSNTLQGVAFSALTPAPQTVDNDTSLLLQGGLFRQISTKAMIASYTPAGAVLVGAGAGASRGVGPGSIPTSGDPMSGYVLHSTLQVLPPVELGGYNLLAVNVGTGAGSVAAGNDSRIVNAAQLDQTGNLHLTGTTFSLAGGGFTITSDGAGNVTMTFNGPNTDPGIAGRVWNNAGLMAISAGPSS